MNNVSFGSNDSINHKGPYSLGDIGFTLLHPFYNEQDRFELQFENWLSWSEEAKRKIQIVLVDDGSPNPVHTWFTPSKLKRLGSLNIIVYRITEDLKWNTPGALNLGFTLAPTTWVLTMDSDCGFNARDIDRFLSATPIETSVYKFMRQRYGDPNIDNLNIVRPLPCAFLIHKNVFWHVGGFDEDFTGEYSGGYALFDTYFFRRLNDLGYYCHTWYDVTAIEWMRGIVKLGRPPENKNHYDINKQIMYKKLEGILPEKSKMLRFNWERTFYHKSD